MISNYFLFFLVEEKELFLLYQRFMQLGPDNHGLISNSKLLEMLEFKFCSFRKYLPKALKLMESVKNFKPEEIIHSQEINERENETKNLEGENFDRNKNEDTYKNNKQNEILKINKNNLLRNEYESVLTINAVENENENLNENSKRENFNKSTKFNKLILNDNRDLDGVNNNNLQENPGRTLGAEDNSDSLLMEVSYIDFARFCNILKVFNPNYPVDMKIKCN